MGSAGSKSEFARLKKAERKLEKALKSKKEEVGKTKRVLLLGPGEAGKSTFMKQMIINRRGGFSAEEAAIAAGQIRSNIVEGILKLVSNARKHSGMATASDEIAGAVSSPTPTPDAKKLSETSQIHSEYLATLELTYEWSDPTAVKSAVTGLWADEAIKAAWTRRSAITGVFDCLEYFIGRLDDIGKPDYCPTSEDVLYARAKTTGVIREMFEISGSKLELIDVGGQRNERRKWMSLFSDVTAILFLIAISEYDQVCSEDESTNRIAEAMEVFNEVVNNPMLKDIPICVFMNKSDLFEAKFKKTSLKTCFTDWDTSKDGDIDAAYAFLETKLKSVSKYKDKDFAFFPTTATNTENVKALWSEIELLVLNKNMDQLGI